MTDLCQSLQEADELSVADVALAANLLRQCGETNPLVHAGVALTFRALREGSICWDFSGGISPGRDDVPVDAVRAALHGSPVVTQGPDGRGIGPLRLDGDALYLERYWGYQESVRRALLARRGLCDDVDPGQLRQALDQFFHGDGLAADEPDLQRRAAAMAVLSNVSFIAGGPGTGKTTTLARLLGVIESVWPEPPRIALAAPTGKAAARLSESVSQLAHQGGDVDVESVRPLQATTLHRLLEARGAATRFGYGPHRQLSHDVVIVDETSMVSVLLMERLLAAIQPSAHIVFVGDPFQLTSVEAGAVLSDIVTAELTPDAALAQALVDVDADGFAYRGLPPGPTAPGVEVVTLQHNYRFLADIADVARAIHQCNADDAVALCTGSPTDPVHLFDADDPRWREEVRQRCVEYAQRLSAAAHADPAEALAVLDQHRLLCGHRHGPWGVSHWTAQIHRWLRDEGLAMTATAWSVGQPIMANVNQPELGIFNGDTGVIVATANGPLAAFRITGDVVLISPSLLDSATDAFAMTVHKSQGSQFQHVTLMLPPLDSPLLTRSLVYTALTRAQTSVTMVGSAEALAQAVTRDVRRASGLQRRLAVPDLTQAGGTVGGEVGVPDASVTLEPSAGVDG